MSWGGISSVGALRQSQEPGSFAWLAHFGRQYGENYGFGFFFFILNGQKGVIYLKILELEGSFTAVFTGSYFCRTEGAIDVNLLLV